MNIRFLLIYCIAFLGFCPYADADVFRWDGGDLIVGTEGVVAEPGVQFGGSDLEFAELSDLDLTGPSFESANLTKARFRASAVAMADFAGAVVRGTIFHDTTSRGFTKEQLYSTASYLRNDLQEIEISGNDFTRWDFRGQNLRNAHFWQSTLTNADITDAVVAEACICEATSRGFTKEQLYSTASYQEKKLQGIGLHGNDMTGWDFGDQDRFAALRW